MGSDRKMDSKMDSKTFVETGAEEPPFYLRPNCPLPLHDTSTYHNEAPTRTQVCSVGSKGLARGETPVNLLGSPCVFALSHNRTLALQAGDGEQVCYAIKACGREHPRSQDNPA
jgi:hypothetical protein